MTPLALRTLSFNPRRAAAAAIALTLAFTLAGCDEELVCPAGETDCRGRCVSLLADEANCGACGSACGPLEACGGGVCGCARGVATCDGACTDLARDPASCGACGAACLSTAPLCATAEGVSSCAASCEPGLSACAGACVDPASDRYHCGACGRACADGESCRDGACRPEIYVACYASGDVRPVNAALEDAGLPVPTSGSPQALAVSGLAIYAANGFPAGVAVLPFGPQLAPRVTVLPGDDVQDLLAHSGAVLVSNSGVETVVVLDASGDVLDEVALPGEQPNPHGLAVAGDTAYVALFGRSLGEGVAPTGQAVARLDLSGLPACLAGGAGPCAVAGDPIDLRAVAGSAPAGGEPFPSRALTIGTRVFVTLSSLSYADCGGGFFDWCKPAGSGRLAVIDTAANDAVSIVDLGPSCGNPGDLALDGDTLWISCGSFGFPDLAPGALVPVGGIGAGGTPSVGAPLATPAGFVPGNLAFCGASGYVTDQASGAVLRFDPAARRADAPPVTVCPTVYFAWAADVECAE